MGRLLIVARLLGAGDSHIDREVNPGQSLVRRHLIELADQGGARGRRHAACAEEQIDLIHEGFGITGEGNEVGIIGGKFVTAVQHEALQGLFPQLIREGDAGVAVGYLKRRAHQAYLGEQSRRLVIRR